MTIRERIRHLFEGPKRRVKLGNRYVGEGEPVFIIAEVGINHNGSVELAKKLIDAAVDAGADAVKFQKRTTKEILTKEGLEKPYTSPHAFASTYGEHREKLEFSEAQYKELKQYAAEKKILFFASVWDRTSTDFMDALGIDAYKIPSADLINLPLLSHVAEKGKPVLLSTGMSTVDEIDAAVETVLQHNHKVVLFHCLSLYPSPEDKINMRFMDVMKERYAPVPVGYSGHEIDLWPTLTAVSRGAVIVERHLTLDKTMKGSDHAASLEPAQFKELVRSIRRIEGILGTSEKVLYDELIPLREKLAKSIATRVAIPKGAIIREDMLTVKGPGSGLKPSRMREVLGKRAKNDIAEDTLLSPDWLE